jgi:hypothetical protein
MTCRGKLLTLTFAFAVVIFLIATLPPPIAFLLVSLTVIFTFFIFAFR